MLQAYEAARRTFRFFWRELSWERRRIVKGLDIAMVKLPFTDGPRSDDKPDCEHMWVDDVEFDGVTLRGTLINQPNWITSVQKGDSVAVPFAVLSDWMMTSNGRVAGAHTVQAMRATMPPDKRKQHDAAWGLDFGDPAEVKLDVFDREGAAGKKPGFFARLFGGKAKSPAPPAPAADEPFRDHPMCVNMLGKLHESLQADLPAWTAPDANGWTMLHHEALAGNLGVVKVLLEHGADPAAKTADGRTVAMLARQGGWEPVAEFLEKR